MTAQVPLDKVEREQRYHTFINKMMQLYKSDKKMKNRLKKASLKMRLAHV